MKRSRRSGFTLVEVLIVITALAIIAGMLVPQFGDAVEDAKRSALLQDWHLLTEAIERYRIHHDGLPPDNLSGTSLPQLTHSTDAAGNIGSGASYPHGPYLVGDIPVNPLNGSNRVVQATTVPPTSLGDKAGWIYDAASGQIWAGTKR